MHVRLAGVYAPEKNTPEGVQAQKFTEDTVLGKDVEVRWYFPEAMYNRPVADIVVKKSGVNLGDEIVNAGLATRGPRPRPAVPEEGMDDVLKSLKEAKQKNLES
jgi:endonuclease YncB( thermonuclease family)